MIRTFFTVIWTIIATVIVSILSTIASFFDKTGAKAHLISCMWGKSILWAANISVDVKGLSNICQSKSYIYMSNHQSFFDIPVIFGYFNTQFRWLAKAELFKIPFLGSAMKSAGCISIDRYNFDSAKSSLEKAAVAVRKKVSVIIFPEGTRTDDGSILPFKKGGFILAVDSKTPIIPIIIRGTREILKKGGFLVKSGKASLEVLPEVDTSNYSRKNKDELVAKVRQIIIDAYNKSDI